MQSQPPTLDDSDDTFRAYDPEKNKKSAEQLLDEADQQILLDEARRDEMMHKIAHTRMFLAAKIHKMENGERLNFERYPFQKEIFSNEAKDLVIMGSVGWGKLQPLTSKVHTPIGWRLMGELKKGDLVSCPDGTAAPIVGVYPQGINAIYKVTFVDGRSTLAGGDHLWEVHHQEWKRKWKKDRSAAGTMKPRVITTLELKRLVEKKHRFPYRIPLSVPVQKPEKKLDLHPYILGALIGDGTITTRHIGFTSADPELVNLMNEYMPFPMEMVKQKHRYAYCLRTRHSGFFRKFKGPLVNPVADSLQRNGLIGTRSHTKFIPREYLEGSVEQRWALIQGLMDTDGTSSPALSYSTASKQLADDVVELVRSLGGIAKIGFKKPTYTYKGEKKNGMLSYKVNIRHATPKKFFRLERKLKALPDVYQYADRLRLEVTSIEQVEDAPAQCIMIDHPSHLYITDDYIVTHNTVYSVLDDFAKAMWGMRVIHVLEKTQKRNIFVGSVIDPIIHANEFYLNLLDIAKDEKAAEMDSATAKSFGDGSMIFLGANSESDFASYRGDATLVDEYQLCNQANIGKLFGRRTGTFYRFETIMGVPTGVGSIENRNLHYQYMDTDQRRWHIPCPHCHREQVLTWEGHFIDVQRNKFGGVTSLKVKDEERAGQNELDIRPLCSTCNMPMIRLHPGGRWIAMNPGSTRRGYQLSSLYNPETSMNSLYKKYLESLNNPVKMAEFINEQLGEPYSESGTNFTLEMLRAAATGHNAGVRPYQFYHQSELGFRPMELN